MIIKINNYDLEVEILIKPQNRNTYLRIKEGKVIISSPKAVKQSDLISFLESNFVFIKKHIDKQNDLKPISHAIHLFGQAYVFKIIENPLNIVRLENNQINIYTTYHTYEDIKKLVTDFYKAELLKFLNENYLSIFNQFLDITQVAPSYKIKDNKTCFAKYLSKTHEIIFMAMLAKYHPFYIKLVIAHELCHIKEKNHQQSFYDLFEQKFPNAKKHQKELRKIVYNDYF